MANRILFRGKAPKRTHMDKDGFMELYADSVAGWVSSFALENYERKLDDLHWCPSWQNHPEASLVLEGLWRSYEEARAADAASAGATNTVKYLVAHFYPLMDRITGDTCLLYTSPSPRDS